MNKQELLAELEKRGVESIALEYSGSGDEGCIDFISPSPETCQSITDLNVAIDEIAYDLLTEKYGCWGDNEGSTGTLTINVKERTATFEHGWYVTEVEQDEPLTLELQ